MASTSSANILNVPVHQLSVPVFDGENYDFWCVKMKTIFLSLDLWDLVANGFVEPESTTTLSGDESRLLKEKKQKDALALGKIQQAVSDTIFPRIMAAAKAKEAWDILQQEFQGSTKVRSIKLQHLRREFENMKMKENETLKEFLDKFMELVNQMKAYGESFNDIKITQKILLSMPAKFDPIVTVIEETRDISTLTVQEVMGSLKSYEQRLLSHSEKSIDSAFQSQLNIKNSKQPLNASQNKGESFRGGKSGRGSGRSWNGRGRGRGRGNFDRTFGEDKHS